MHSLRCSWHRWHSQRLQNGHRDRLSRLRVSVREVPAAPAVLSVKLFATWEWHSNIHWERGLVYRADLLTSVSNRMNGAVTKGFEEDVGNKTSVYVHTSFSLTQSIIGLGESFKRIPHDEVCIVLIIHHNTVESKMPCMLWFWVEHCTLICYSSLEIKQHTVKARRGIAWRVRWKCMTSVSTRANIWIDIKILIHSIFNE